MLDYFLLIVGFGALMKGADLLVDGSTSVARRLGVSDFIIGLTIVSMGTSMPELLVNVVAGFQEKPDIAIGNVVGSNIANILLILGVTAIICPLPIKRSTMMSEIPFSLTATVLLGFVANAALFDSNQELQISRLDGSILLGFFILFLAYIVSVSRESQDAIPGGDDMPEGNLPALKSYLWILLGMAGLFIGGKLVVNSAESIALSLGFSESFIGLTVVAIGTSLPELVTSATAALKQRTEIAVANVIGSNIFNILWILGLSACIHPLSFTTITNDDILILIGSNSLILLALITGKRNAIDRWEGVVFIVLYIAYITYLVFRG